MLNINNITNFNDVLLKTKKTLIICNIDNTILYYDKEYNYFYESVKKNFPFRPENVYEEDAYFMYTMYKKYYNPIHTDYEGFMNMKNKIKKLDGLIIFITNRNIKNIEQTKKHFNNIGMNYNDYIVYYLNNNLSINEYISNYIQNFNEIIYIDNNEDIINSLINIFPNIIYYKFNYISK
jgi:hypothetical protein